MSGYISAERDGYFRGAKYAPQSANQAASVSLADLSSF
jgi:hypothetical protein